MTCFLPHVLHCKALFLVVHETCTWTRKDKAISSKPGLSYILPHTWQSPGRSGCRFLVHQSGCAWDVAILVSRNKPPPPAVYIPTSCGKRPRTFGWVQTSSFHMYSDAIFPKRAQPKSGLFQSPRKVYQGPACQRSRFFSSLLSPPSL